jgi:hypothetical protein
MRCIPTSYIVNLARERMNLPGAGSRCGFRDAFTLRLSANGTAYFFIRRDADALYKPMQMWYNRK